MPDPVRTFRHHLDVPERDWRWKNFSPAEIACRGTGQLKLHPEAIDKLQALRDRLGKPLIVRSAYRSPEHNRAVGGGGGRVPRRQLLGADHPRIGLAAWTCLANPLPPVAVR